MYKYKKATPTDLKINKSYKGERLEQKINRIVNNNEPIEDSSPLIYTERKEGVLPQYDIRTDRWDVAIDAMDKVDKSHQANRQDRLNPKKEEEIKDQSTQGKDGDQQK